MPDRILPQSFYARDALDVARDLLGKRIRHGPVVVRITEVEAYRIDDTANHCRMGRTPRNEPMWGPPGHAYVYLCYGMHNLLNLVTDREGEGAAVLIRACEPVRGARIIEERRRGIRGPASLTGPGKVAAALALDTGFSGHAAYRRGGLCVLDDVPPPAIVAGPRVGIDYANPEDIAAPYRLAVADSKWVSQPRASLTRRCDPRRS